MGLPPCTPHPWPLCFPAARTRAVPPILAHQCIYLPTHAFTRTNTDMHTCACVHMSTHPHADSLRSAPAQHTSAHAHMCIIQVQPHTHNTHTHSHSHTHTLTHTRAPHTHTVRERCTREAHTRARARATHTSSSLPESTPPAQLSSGGSSAWRHKTERETHTPKEKDRGKI